MTYTYRKDTGGTTILIESPTGDYVTHICYWDEEEKAERTARFICDALNAFRVQRPQQ